MANLIRSGKSGSDWSKHELKAFNIEVVEVDAAAFFGTEVLPASTASDTILNNLTKPDGPVSKSDRQFFQLLDLAERASSEESAVDDFAAHILRMLDFDSDSRIVRLRKEMSFYMCGQRVDAKADVALMDDENTLLLVQEDKRTASKDDPEPQLVAETVAAFYQNRQLQEALPGSPPLQRQVVPGIAMIGTAPVFYRAILTSELLDALVSSAYPAEKTIVLRYTPRVPHQKAYRTQGMRPLDNRHIVLQCFEALKKLINA